MTETGNNSELSVETKAHAFERQFGEWLKGASTDALLALLNGVPEFRRPPAPS